MERFPSTMVETISARCGQSLSAVDSEALWHALNRAGSVLLRGFPCEREEFERLTARFCDRFHRPATRAGMKGGRGDGTTTQAPQGNFTLLAHNEASYRPFPPPQLAFLLCLEAPASDGGESMLVDGRAFLARLPSDLRRRFEDLGVIFTARWERERWEAELEVEDDRALAGLQNDFPGLGLGLESGILKYRWHTTAIQPDRLGVAVFANAILAHLPAVSHPGYTGLAPYARADNGVFFGDGQPLSEDVINTLIDIQDEVALDHRLEDGDLLVLDNTRVMHGRRATASDCRRRLLARFGYLRDSQPGTESDS